MKRLIISYLILLQGCGTPSSHIDSAPVAETANFKGSPESLATCFQASFMSRYPDTLTFERQKTDGVTTLYALMFGNDLILAKRYYWRMQFSALGNGTAVTLQILPDWIGDSHAGPEVWRILEACAG